MYSGLLYTHSVLRYFLLFLLLMVVVKSLAGWLGGKPYTKGDNQFSLFLLIATHLQLLVGLLLYFVSPAVQFSSETMKAPYRYWTVEHIFMMLIAVVLITIARISHKKLPTDTAKHKRLFILNAVALLIIIVAIVASGRGLIGGVVFR
jgi:hypothetical protein